MMRRSGRLLTYYEAMTFSANDQFIETYVGPRLFNLSNDSLSALGGPMPKTCLLWARPVRPGAAAYDQQWAFEISRGSPADELFALSGGADSSQLLGNTAGAVSDHPSAEILYLNRAPSLVYAFPTWGAGFVVGARRIAGAATAVTWGVHGFDCKPEDLLPPTWRPRSIDTGNIAAGGTSTEMFYCAPNYTRVRGSVDATRSFELQALWHQVIWSFASSSFVSATDIEIVATGGASAEQFFDLPMRSHAVSFRIRNTDGANASANNFLDLEFSRY